MDQHADVESRRRTARVLANAAEAELAELWEAWPDRPQVQYLRGPEAGLVMVQGRTGGTGDRFNLGEATVTRATVVVRSDAAGDPDEAVGTAYVLGSHPDHAGLAAIFDAMLASGRRDRVLAEVIEPLERAQAERDALARAEARSTVVDFFTVSRENDGARENSGPDEEDDE
ncbi:phosphonate C-P lyase system protein PhnG [Microbacterium paludicola]|uniref:Phosphonate C-P lyase system protein PhnG n=1 Tax=Microbacterium paludicola TaxID=300019 RepID=A0A4Y9FZQ7_9MICO|nr:phosphonate C-P lyase system protein PhnG [Microbacterium paludicola]MBF0815231.1 phosphonate C-P lyase system protein PhnG [Microbacterium paludicola]TFU34107.1 phosphonate C-P lyase system protein PhnG [Microbacterium paludicola]